ncbi:condensin [Babesia gibsoni]|uniref:Condensin n=1 Tax=Babesia gibsoni TaxID=33632 RepID=A0AAD8LS35_BABGI|nr:condensin [Babesia gibsoni]
MANRNSLMFFKIPESLDYMSLLRPPGPDDIGRLDASDADDPENWTPEEIDSAIGAVCAVVSRGPQDALDMLTKDSFNHAFNLMRHFPNLAKNQQMAVCQSFSVLCNKNHDILQKIPATPYFNQKDTADNPLYVDLEYKITSSCPNLSKKGGLESLAVSPSDMGLVLRSMCHLCTFLVCMTFKSAMNPPKDSEKSSMSLDLTQGKKGKGAKGTSKKKKQEDSAVNQVALELLIDCMLTITKSSMNPPFSGAYGGNGSPDQPLLRLLFETMFLAMGSRIAGFVGDKLKDAVSRMFKINYDIMQEKRNLLKKTETEGKKKDEDDLDAEDKPKPDESPISPKSVDDGTSVYEEWLSTMADEIKKSHCAMIADSMEMLRDTEIPEAIMAEVTLTIKENFVLQAHSSSSQLMSFAVQNEYTNIGVFIERLSKRMPVIILKNHEELRQLFDVPSYNLRKSIMESLKSLIIMAKSEDTPTEEDDAAMKEMEKNTDSPEYAAKACAKYRETLLQLLLARQYDTYMYARASLLKVFQDIIEGEALPVRWYVTTANLALARLMDKGSQVRQRALNLLTTMILDATTKRFKLPMDMKSLKNDLSVLDYQIQKLDEVANLTIIMSGKPLPVAPPTAEEGDAAAAEANGLPPEPTPPTPKEMEEAKKKKEQLIKELNDDLQENIQMDDDNSGKAVKTRLLFAREMYSDVHDISVVVEKSIEIARDMLRSSVETDQRAAIKYIATCHLMGVGSASALLPKVWVLSWSNNQNVVDAVLNEFKNVYFSDPDENNIAMRLIKLLARSQLTDFASIEKIFEVNLGREQPYFSNMDKLMVALLRIAVAPNYQLGRDVIPRVALGMMRLILWSSMRSKLPQAHAIRNIDEKKLSALKGLLQLSIEKSLTIFGEVCLILTKASTSKHTEEISEYVLKLFRDTFGSMDDAWFRMAQCVVDVIFTHCKTAEVIWSQELCDMINKLISAKGGKGSLRMLAQIIFVAGHVAIRTIISLDRLQTDLKGVRAELETFGDKGGNDASSQMGMATSDEQEREIFEKLGERNIVCSNLLGGPLRTLIVECLHDPAKFVIGGLDGDKNFDQQQIKNRGSMDKETAQKVAREIDIVKTCAAIAICKYATVSKQFCQSVFMGTVVTKSSNLEVIISLLLNKRLDPRLSVESQPTDKHRYYYLKEPTSTTLRSTLLISYGDLLCRHPNLLDPWNSEVCMIILDRDERIRETAVLVFTHLVMNDMVKPKGKLIDGMMYLTLDTHERISENAKTFFHEIHKKNPNTIYNCFPEMIVTLASNKRNQSVARNMCILNMLLQFIKKDKQAESIIEKVCLRLQSTELRNRMAIIIYSNVLLKVNYDEKCMRKLLSSIPLMTHLIIESEILLAALLIICKRVKSSHQPKKGGEGEKPAEAAEGAAEGAGADAGASGGLSENASLKDMAEEIVSKLHALFGEGKSARVNDVAANADTIMATVEKEENTHINYLENLFIHNFGYVSANAHDDLSDDDLDDLDGQAATRKMLKRVKMERMDDSARALVKREREVAAAEEASAPKRSAAADKKKAVAAKDIKTAVIKSAAKRINEFDSSDEDDDDDDD